MPVLLIPVDTGDVQRLDVPRFVLADAALDLGLFADIHAVLRLEDNLLETFESEIGLDPRRLPNDTAAAVRNDLAKTLIQLRKGMGITAGQDRFRLGVLSLVFGAVGRKKIFHISRVPEECIAELVHFIGNQELALLAALSADTVTVRRRDD